ncbi:MAG: phenylacetate--CoA ligase, partial [Kiritimatiellae bacterium]|nr:phenylacetate--CoA ligase [Kiritimatiellia bacterium]
MTVLDTKRETLPREQIEQVQLERLQALIARLRRNVRRYREMLGDVEVKSLDDLERLPFTTPEDLLASFPYGMFALPLREVMRLHSSVGPDGKQLVVGHTRNDLANWGRLVARQLAAANVSNHDVIQVCLEGGVFSGAAGYLLGAEIIGASVIPEDPIHVEYQLSMLQNYRATVLITSPTNARDLLRLL